MLIFDLRHKLLWWRLKPMFSRASINKNNLFFLHKLIVLKSSFTRAFSIFCNVLFSAFNYHSFERRHKVKEKKVSWKNRFCCKTILDSAASVLSGFGVNFWTLRVSWRMFLIKLLIFPLVDLWQLFVQHRKVRAISSHTSTNSHYVIIKWNFRATLIALSEL